MDTLAKRILHLRGGKSQTEFSSLLGVAQNTLGRYERGERVPDAEFLLTLVCKLDVSAEWLLTGEGPMKVAKIGKGQTIELNLGPAEETRDALDELKNLPGVSGAPALLHHPQPLCDVDMVYIPLVEARLSAGTGSFVTGDESDKRYGFRSDFLCRKGQISKMVLMRVDGDSMEPEIHHGDVVLIDQSQTTPRAGAMFAVGVEDLVYIKMVDALPGKIILKSCNDSYRPLEIDARGDLADGIRIVGKAVWLGRELR